MRPNSSARMSISSATRTCEARRRPVDTLMDSGRAFKEGVDFGVAVPGREPVDERLDEERVAPVGAGGERDECGLLDKGRRPGVSPPPSAARATLSRTCDPSSTSWSAIRPTWVRHHRFPATRGSGLRHGPTPCCLAGESPADSIRPTDIAMLVIEATGALTSTHCSKPVHPTGAGLAAAQSGQSAAVMPSL